SAAMLPAVSPGGPQSERSPVRGTESPIVSCPVWLPPPPPQDASATEAPVTPIARIPSLSPLINSPLSCTPLIPYRGHSQAAHARVNDIPISRTEDRPFLAWSGHFTRLLLTRTGSAPAVPRRRRRPAATGRSSRHGSRTRSWQC